MRPAGGARPASLATPRAPRRARTAVRPLSEALRPGPEVLRIDRVGYGHPDALLLIAGVQAEYGVRYGGPDRTPLDPLMFEPPTGSFFVGHLPSDSRPVVSGAWRSHDDVAVFDTRRTAEVKRMYVAPSARGRGLARLMLSHLERTAADSGAEAMILETGTAQPEAIGLSAPSGSQPTPPFGS